MKNIYNSPEFEVIKLALTADILTVSEPEKPKDPIVIIHDPDDDLLEELP